jgi:hypothetical protein
MGQCYSYNNQHSRVHAKGNVDVFTANCHHPSRVQTLDTTSMYMPTASRSLSDTREGQTRVRQTHVSGNVTVFEFMKDLSNSESVQNTPDFSCSMQWPSHGVACH